MSLGFRKNDYKNISSDVTEEDIPNIPEETGPSPSEVSQFHDSLWEIWNTLKDSTESMSVPIFDKGTFPDFLNFITDNDPYFEK